MVCVCPRLGGAASSLWGKIREGVFKHQLGTEMERAKNEKLGLSVLSLVSGEKLHLSAKFSLLPFPKKGRKQEEAKRK